jgi:hypothetical protein
VEELVTESVIVCKLFDKNCVLEASGRVPAPLSSNPSATKKKKKDWSWAPVAYICNPSYLGS